MICGMDFHEVINRSGQAIIIYFLASAPKMVPAYHSHLCNLSSLEQNFTLGLSILRSSQYHAQDTPYQHTLFVLIGVCIPCVIARLLLPEACKNDRIILITTTGWINLHL